MFNITAETLEQRRAERAERRKLSDEYYAVSNKMYVSSHTSQPVLARIKQLDDIVFAPKLRADHEHFMNVVRAAIIELSA